MRKNFMSINIPRLPVYTTEEGIKYINKNLNKLKDWKEIFKFIPREILKSKKLRKSGMTGIFSASLELSKQGIISMMQKKIFDKILIKHKND